MPDLVPSLSCRSGMGHGAMRICGSQGHAFGPTSVHAAVEIHRIERAHDILACFERRPMASSRGHDAILAGRRNVVCSNLITNKPRLFIRDSRSWNSGCGRRKHGVGRRLARDGAAIAARRAYPATRGGDRRRAAASRAFSFDLIAQTNTR